MFYWFMKGIQKVRVEAREVSPTRFELTVTGPTAVSASTSSPLEKRSMRATWRWNSNSRPTAGPARTAGMSE